MEILPTQVSNLESARASIFVTNFVTVSIIQFSTVNTLEIPTIHLDYSQVHIVRTNLHVSFLRSDLSKLHVAVVAVVLPYLQMYSAVVHPQRIPTPATSERLPTQLTKHTALF